MKLSLFTPQRQILGERTMDDTPMSGSESEQPTPYDSSRKETEHSGTAGPISSAQIILLRQRDERHTGRLVEFLTEQGLNVQVADVFSLSSSQLEEADLIFLETLDRIDAVTETVVARIRLESRVPLVMLTDGHSTEQLVSALSAGVDAIWSLASPPEVLLARCRALLRRWMPD